MSGYVSHKGSDEDYSDQNLAALLKRAGAKLDIFGVYGLLYGCLAAPNLSKCL